MRFERERKTFTWTKVFQLFPDASVKYFKYDPKIGTDLICACYINHSLTKDSQKSERSELFSFGYFQHNSFLFRNYNLVTLSDRQPKNLKI